MHRSVKSPSVNASGLDVPVAVVAPPVAAVVPVLTGAPVTVAVAVVAPVLTGAPVTVAVPVTFAAGVRQPNWSK